MELPIVNEDDIEIGTKEREQLSKDDIYRVSALWVVNSKGEHLLAQRALSKKKNPGKWGPAVAGTVEVGETYETNIVKEIQEELGITLTIENLRLGPKTQRLGPDGTYFVQWYFATVDKSIEDFNCPKDEVAGLKWLTEQELREVATNKPEELLTSVIEILDVVLSESKEEIQ
jgi:isopentenyldiphosphate isomerase